jgi:hypothetical protein
MRIPLLLAFALLAACGTPEPSGIDEPFHVVGGQFFEGPLPGIAPDAPDGGDGPKVFAFGWENPVILPGQGSKSIHGRVSESATSVALRFTDMGSGYWVVPTGPLEPQYPGERTFSVKASFTEQLPAGSHPIAIVAIDADGKPGRQHLRSVCVAGPIPDNLAGCNPDTAPPAMVVSLSWNVDADVDLQIIASDGRIATPEKPLLDPIAQGVRPDPSAPRIDRDSLEACVPDGLRRENFILQERLPSGTSLAIHAKLKDACGFSSVAFRLGLHERRGDEGAWEVVETFSTGGFLNEFEAGLQTGLFLGRIDF